MTGVVVVVGVLVLATLAGLLQRARNGRFRPVAGPSTGAAAAGGKAPVGAAAAEGEAPMGAATAEGGAAAEGGATVVAAAAGVARTPNSGGTAAPTSTGLDPVLAGLGVTTDTVTLLQFSSSFCAPCRTTRVLCADVAEHVAGVRHVEVDAESHLDAVRALEIWRTPTVLVIDGGGAIVRRASGAPTRAQLVAAVTDLLPG